MSLRSRTVLATGMFSLCAAPLALAAPAGTPAAAFGTNGVRALSVAGADLYPNAIVRAPDGSLLVLAAEAGQTQARVFKVSATGTTDATFGGLDGVAELPVAVGSVNSTSSQLALAADGSIIVAGRAGTDAVVGELTSSGQPKTSFGSAGVATLPLGSALSADATTVDVRPDGRIVVTGRRTLPGDESGLFAAELTAAGQPTTAFGPDGQRAFDPVPGSGKLELTGDALLAPDGRLLLAVEESSAGAVLPDDGVVLALGADGAPDPAFATGGSFSFAGRENENLTTLEAIDGARLWVAGIANDGGYAAVSGQITYDGAPAPGSPAAGRFGGLSLPVDFTALPDGSLVGVGGRATGPVEVEAIAGRLKPDGTLDEQWNAGGTPGVTVLSRDDVSSAVAVVRDGDRVVVAHGDATTPTAADDAVTLTALSVDEAPTVSLAASPQRVERTAGETITLTATAADVDGPATLTYRYDYDDDGVADLETAAATASFPASPQPGEHRARVVVADALGKTATATATYTTTAPPAATFLKPPKPSFVGAYVITGGVVPGRQITCAPFGSWTGAERFSYTWTIASPQRGVPGKIVTEVPELIVPASLGSTITCAVTATNAGGSTTVLPESSQGKRIVAGPPVLTGRPTLVGSPVLGAVLTCVPPNAAPPVEGIQQVTWYDLSGPTRRVLAGSDRYTVKQGDAFVLCEVTPSNTAGVGAAAESDPVSIVPFGDVRVDGIEVTQGVQPARDSGTFWGGPYLGSGVPSPLRDLRDFRVPVLAPELLTMKPNEGVYTGVRLVRGKTTTVRVFTSSSNGAPVTVKLETLDLFGTTQTRLLTFTPALTDITVTDERRAGTKGVATFSLPTDQPASVSVRATVVPQYPAAECTSTRCRDDDSFTLRKVPFVELPPVAVVAVPFSFKKPAKVVNAGLTVGLAATRLPAGPALVTRTVSTPIAADGFKIEADGTSSDAAVALLRFGGVGPDRQGDVVVGVDDGRFRGGMVSNILVRLANDPAFRVPVVGVLPTFSGDTRKQVTGVHELGHALGNPHSGHDATALTSTDANRVTATDKCYSEDMTQLGADWPADQRGRFQGWQVLDGVERADGRASNELYDVMSYCADLTKIAGKFDQDSDGNFKLTLDNSPFAPRNWDAQVNNLLANRGRLLRPRAAALRAVTSPGLRVMATLDGAAPRLLSVTPATGTVAQPAGGMPVDVVTRDAAGGEVGRVAGTAQAPADGGAPLLDVVVPATGAARLELQTGAGVVASRDRSAAAPVVKLLSPAAGATLGRSRDLAVRWSQSDADGDPLSAAVEYSSDAGRSWKLVTLDQAGTGRARIVAADLPTSADARVRVRVSDGFNEGTAVSGRLRSLGAPPAITVLAPVGKQKLGGGDVLVLEGRGVDETGRRLSGRALTWTVDGRVAAHGEHAKVRALSPGRHRVRLVARDARGRTTTSRAAAVTAAVPPLAFTTLSAPASVKRSATTVRVRVAATRTAQLTVRGRSYRVGVEPRTLRLALPRGRADVRLSMTLRSGTARRATLLEVAR